MMVLRVDGLGSLSQRFERQVLREGPGTWQRAGLIAVAEQAENRQRRSLANWLWVAKDV